MKDDLQHPLKGKVALVTGAARGIGAQISRSLAQAGASVIINYRSSEKEAIALVEEIRKDTQGQGDVIALEADASTKDGAEFLAMAARRKIGKPIDILVHNASDPAQNAAFADTSAEQFSHQFDTSVGGAAHCIHAVLPDMIASKSGSIVFIATSYTVGMPPAKLSSYVTAKHALVGLAKALAVELGPQGIRVNCVSPSVIKTDLTSHLPEKLFEIAAMQTPLRRICTALDVAQAVVFLASDQAAFITGVNLPVTGGMN